jgi:glycosyltransferase involved in cell wall biosynthesis
VHVTGSGGGLRIGAPPLLTMLPPTFSSGKIWRNVLPRLDRWAEVVERDPHQSSNAGIDIWIWDGQQGALEVSEPFVAHIHEAPWDDPAVRVTVMPELVERLDAASRAATERAARVVSGSESGRSQLIERYGLDPAHVDVALNGVDVETFRPDGPKGGRLIDAAGGDGLRPYVLFVGSVLPRKNLPLLREAMGVLTERGHPHDLVLVAGIAIDRDSTQLLREAVRPIAGRPVVNLAGVSEEELASLMRGATVLCAPSVTEGFGMPVVEAMACGTPAVVSDRGALPEVLGDGGLAVEPERDAIVAALDAILRNEELRDDLGRRAARRGAGFTWDATAAAIWLTLQRALGQ